jgi:hypothetical protein
VVIGPKRTVSIARSQKGYMLQSRQPDTCAARSQNWLYFAAMLLSALPSIQAQAHVNAQ